MMVRCHLWSPRVSPLLSEEGRGAVVSSQLLLRCCTIISLSILSEPALGPLSFPLRGRHLKNDRRSSEAPVEWEWHLCSHNAVAPQLSTWVMSCTWVPLNSVAKGAEATAVLVRMHVWLCVWTCMAMRTSEKSLI